MLGTCAVPGAASVAAGVPVDATVGTAVLTVDAIPALLIKTTIATLASQTSFTLAAGSADNGAYPAGATVVVQDAVTATQKAVGSVASYVGASKTLVLSADPGVFVMAVGDSVSIIAGSSGGAGGTDWNTTERNQIRHRLGIDGTAAAPAAAPSLASPTNITAAAGVQLAASQPAYAPSKAGDAMTLTTGERSTLTAAVEAALINDADGQALLAAISTKIQTLFDNGVDVPVATLVSLIAAQITTDHGAGSYNTAAATAALDGISATALARFATVNTGQSTAATGSVAKLSQGTGGGGGGDATLANQVAILAALSGTPISPVARVASGGAVLLFVGDDATQASSTLLSIPVDDPAGAVLTKLQAIGVANLSFGASRSNLPASAIAGTVKTLTASTVDGNPVCLIGVEVRAAGVSPACAPADDYVYQISQRQTHASDLDDFVEIEGSLELRRRTVAIPS